MSKKQEELTVREMMRVSGILVGIEQLRGMIKSYQARVTLQGQRYTIQREFYELEKTIELFENQLKSLLERANVWEIGR